MIKALVEMSQGDKYKFELDKASGRLELDRPLNIPTPCNYGFIKNTLAMDGDPLDVFIITNKPLPHLCTVKLEVLGGFECVDNGVLDEKIIAKIQGDTEATPFIVENETVEIECYLRTYKKGFQVKKYLNKAEALKLVNKYDSKHR